MTIVTRKHIINVTNNLANEPARLRRLFRGATKQATEANIPDKATTYITGFVVLRSKMYCRNVGGPKEP